jgi:multiple sugar transport system substrate-binding protein
MAAASDQLWDGAITRADFLRVCADAGIGLAGLGLSKPRRVNAGTPTTPQIRATAGPSSPVEPSTDQQKFLRDVGRAFAGQTVHVVTEDTPPSLATREIMKQEFMPHTGIHVEWELLPLDRVLAKVSADTARQAGANDIFYLDQAWVGRFVNDTVPVKELLAKKELAYPGYDFDDILPSLVEHIASYNGQVVGIP